MDLMTVLAGAFVALAVYYIVQRFFLSPKRKTEVIDWQNEWQEKSSSSSGSGEASGSESGVELKIFYGSQTGTAEDFANTLADEARAYGFKPEVIDLEDYECDDLESVELAIYCMATYGEGEPTDNARPFNEWILQEHEDTLLQNMKFAVFGLGNKTYEQYNSMAKRTSKQLKEKGGEEVYEMGLGDDDASLEEDFEKWKSNLWPSMCNAAGIEMTEQVEVKKMRKYVLQEYEEAPPTLSSHHFTISAANELDGSYLNLTENLTKGNHKSYKMYDTKNPFLAKVVVHRELHAQHSDRSCLHIELELIKNTYLKYSPGDHIGIFGENDPELVEHVAARLGVNPNTVIKLNPAPNSKATPIGPFTIRRALSSYADITARPRQAFLKEIAQYAEDEEERARLARLGDASNDASVAEYKRYVLKEYRSVADILDEFPSLNPPIDHFLEMAPRLDPRFYSISSAMEATPGRVSVTAVVVQVPKVGGKHKIHKGVCTNWMANLRDRVGGVVFPCFIRKSEFKLPKDPKTPIIMVGPGTGIAPFRGFLQWRKVNVDKVGKAILFFGCRRYDCHVFLQLGFNINCTIARIIFFLFFSTVFACNITGLTRTICTRRS